jgi:hypothetical protein
MALFYRLKVAGKINYLNLDLVLRFEEQPGAMRVVFHGNRAGMRISLAEWRKVRAVLRKHGRILGCRPHDNPAAMEHPWRKSFADTSKK